MNSLLLSPLRSLLNTCVKIVNVLPGGQKKICGYTQYPTRGR